MTNESYLIGRLEYDLIRYFYDLVVKNTPIWQGRCLSINNSGAFGFSPAPASLGFHNRFVVCFLRIYFASRFYSIVLVAIMPWDI